MLRSPGGSTIAAEQVVRKQWDGRPHPKRHQRAKVEMLVTT
jgi:hypothetical protein